MQLRPAFARASLAATALLAGAPAPLHAAAALLIERVERGTAGEGDTVTLVAPENGDPAAGGIPPETIDASFVTGAGAQPVTLRRMDTDRSPSAGPAARFRFAARLPLGPGTLVLAPPGGEGPAYALAAPLALASSAAPAGPEGGPGLAPPDFVASPAIRARNAFLGNISGYRPSYAVIGAGGGENLKLQLSLQYQPFGTPGERPTDWLEGFRLGYTQRMYMDIGADSTPFRDIDFSPELFYRYDAPIRFDAFRWGGQAGIQHISNGRDGAASRTVNMLYAEPSGSWRIGGETLTVAPRLWIYLGSLRDNPDIRRYRGNAGLSLDFGRENGLRLAAETRFNPGSGKGAVESNLTYPVEALGLAGVDIYLFAQGFAGYGENLLDYDRRQTRLRLGIGLIR